LTHLTVLQPVALEGEVLGRADCVRVVGIVRPFGSVPTIRDLPAGLSVAELLAECCGGRVPEAARVTLGDHVIERALWHCVRPKAGTHLSFRVLVQGGGGFFRTVLPLLFVIAAAFLAPYLAGVLAPGLAGTGLAILEGVIGFAVTAIGNFLVNALFPVKTPKLDSPKQGDQVNSISSARNQSDPWGAVPVILGRHRVAPKYAAAPWTEIIGNDQYLRLLFCVGFGPLLLEDLRIGQTPIAAFEGVELEILQGYGSDPAPTLYPNQVYEQTFDVLLDAGEEYDEAESVIGAEGLRLDYATEREWHERRTEDNVDEIGVDVVAAEGLYRITDTGKLRDRFVAYRIEYRLVGDAGAWTLAPGLSGNLTNIEDNICQEARSMEPVRWGYRWVVPNGQYDVRLQRISPTENVTNKRDLIKWTALRGFRNASPLNVEQPLALVAMRIKASDQLNGVVDTFNLLVTSILPDWQPNASPPAWTPQPTNNPASLWRAVLQGPANARALPDERLDLPKLQAWHEECAAEGWTFNQIRDFSGAVYDALTDITSASFAATAIRDGVWTVLTFDATAPIVQLFTPRNSWGFSAERAYREFPHGWRARFINEDKEYQEDERIIYEDGFDEGTATRFEQIEFPGVTKPSSIWRLGRRHLAQAKLRPETYSLNVDWEQLVCSRGDRVRVAHDVALWGLGWARVKSISGLEITLDDFMPMEADKSYCIRFRSAAGESLLFAVVTAAGENYTVALVDPGDSPLALPEPGDLAVFGEVGEESVDLAVMSIEPGEDFSARITLVDWAPGIAAADSGAIPPFDSHVTPPLDLRGRLPPGNLQFSDGLVRAGPVVQSLATLSWQRPRISGPVGYEVQYRAAGGDWGPAIRTDATSQRFVNLDSGLYDFRVRTLGPNNTSSAWAVLSGRAIEGLAAPPAAVTQFRAQIVGSIATLSWSPAPELDLSHYEIRFQPVLTGALWQNALVLAPNISGTSYQTAAQVGTWLIKPVDTSGVFAEEATLVASSVASIDGLNVVALLDEAAGSPVFAGVAHPDSVNVRVDGGALQLDDVDVEITEASPFIEGFYCFDQGIDLGQAYNSRVSGLVGVTGIDREDDVFARADWFDVVDYFGGEVDGYEVELQARWTVDDPAVSPVAWSDWTPFVVMDVTARAYQFRLRLRSYQRHVTPSVTALAANVDMPDRVAAGEDVAVGSGGESILFAPAFKETPAIVATLQDGATGDYVEITAKSKTGFDIIAKNSAGAGVARSIDWVAKGYGVEV